MYTPRGRVRAARPRAGASRLASAATSPRLLRREALAQRRRRDARAPPAARPGVRSGAGRAGRGRGRSPAPARAARQLRDLLVGEDHQPLDQAVGLGLGDRRGRRRRCPRRRSRTPARPIRRRGWSAPRCSPSAAATSRAAASGSATAAGGSRPAGEDRVELVVVEAGVGADAAAVEAGRARPRPRPQLDLGGHRQPLDPGGEAAGVAAERVRQHRLDRAGDVGAVGAPPRLEVERRARPHVGGDVGDVDPDPGAVALALGGDGVVEVAGGGRVDGEGRRARSGRGGRRSARSAALGGLAASASSAGAEAAEAELLAQQLLDRLAGARLPARRGVARAAPRASRWARAGRACRRRLSLRPGRRATPSARSFPSSAGVSGSSPTLTSGWMPWLRARLTPSGVKYSPTVSFRAPPLARSFSSWKTPLP